MASMTTNGPKARRTCLFPVEDSCPNPSLTLQRHQKEPGGVPTFSLRHSKVDGIGGGPARSFCPPASTKDNQAKKQSVGPRLAQGPPAQ